MIKKPLLISLSALVLSLGAFLSSEPVSVVAAPIISCSNSSHTVEAILNGDGTQVGIYCLNDDASEASVPSVGTTGTDTDVICQDGAQPTVTTDTADNGTTAVVATCSGGIATFSDTLDGARIVGDTTVPPPVDLGDAVDNNSLNRSAGGNEGEGFNLSQPDGADFEDVGELGIECGEDTDDPDKVNVPIMCTLIDIVNFLSIGVGVVAAITVAVSGMQYTMARGDPNQTSKAISRLVQVGTAIVLYVFGWALLNWLIPGGVI